MKGQHKNKTNFNNILPKEGQRKFSCCNETGTRCPSLVFNSPEEEEMAFETLAKILTNLYYRLYENGEIDQ